MGSLSRFAVRHPWQALLIWIVFAASIIGSSLTWGGTLNDSFELPDTDSAEAQTLLSSLPGDNSSGLGEAKGKIVWGAADVTTGDASSRVTKMLERVAETANVECVITPYGAPLGEACSDEVKAAAKQQAAIAEASAIAEAGGELTEAQQAALEAATKQKQFFDSLNDSAKNAVAGLEAAGISNDKTVGYATFYYNGSAKDDENATPLKETSTTVFGLVKALHQADGYSAGVSSPALEEAGAEVPTSEVFGVVVALIILLLVFGSFVAAFLPIISSLLSLAVGLTSVTLIARGLDVAEFAPTLAAMIGLGVGIDYALFVMNRFQQALAAGRSSFDAAMESVNTAGRAVGFAAFTVIIALLGLMTTGVNFFTGLALASSSTVLSMMIGATFVLPAFLAMVGKGAFALRLPWMKDKAMESHEHGFFSRYGRWLERNFKWLGPIAFIILGVISAPLLSLNLGFADASGREDDNSARIAYDLTAEGFSPGLNGPFVVAVDLHNQPGDVAMMNKITTAIAETDGVDAAVGPPTEVGTKVGVIQVIPSSGPQQDETSDLLVTLRDDVLPDATSGTSVKAHVGGAAAITKDFTSVLVGALPLFLTLVVGLGIVMLMVLFRSILVPVIGAATSLLSFGAAMGVAVAVFQWGWLAGPLGVTEIGPIMPFLPIMVFAILFGLSMDYQVFLVSKMQEEWEHTKDNAFSVKEGIGSSGRVVAIAAAIMFSVFAAFIADDNVTIKLFGISLATAVLFDALLVRLIVVPAFMFTLGKANWWLPSFLKKILPKFSVEGASPAQASAAPEVEKAAVASSPGESAEDLLAGVTLPDPMTARGYTARERAKEAVGAHVRPVTGDDEGEHTAGTPASTGTFRAAVSSPETLNWGTASQSTVGSPSPVDKDSAEDDVDWNVVVEDKRPVVDVIDDDKASLADDAPDADHAPERDAVEAMSAAVAAGAASDTTGASHSTDPVRDGAGQQGDFAPRRSVGSVVAKRQNSSGPSAPVKFAIAAVAAIASVTVWKLLRRKKK